MLQEKVKKSNIAATIWFISLFALLYQIGSGDVSGNIWDERNWSSILVFTVHGISLFAALWYYSEAKGYSGFLGIGLAFLYALGLIILLVLPDKNKAQAVVNDSTTDIGPKNDPIQPTGNYFVRLFKDEIPLVITYWVWGTLVGALLLGGMSAVESNYAAIIVKPYGILLTQTFYWFVLAYSAFIWVAIWRSAGKYQGSDWGVAARVMVVAGILMTLGMFIRGLDEEAGIAEQVRMMNVSLPTMLDASTRLDSVEYGSKTMTFLHTVVDGTVDDFDVEYLHATIKASAVGDLCSGSDSRDFLRDGIAYAYSYVDMNGTYLTDITVTDADCE